MPLVLNGFNKRTIIIGVNKLAELKKRKLYDTESPNRSTGIINGNSSNILNWDDTAHSWTYPLYKNMVSRFWRPEEINLMNDVKQWQRDLSEEERETFKRIIGLLAFLDSVQSDFCGKVSDYLTDSSFVAITQVIGFFEVVHNQSYSYVLSSLVSKKEQDEIFNYWRDEPILLERNKFIAEGYADFTENPTPETFLKAIVYDIILEGLFFYAGFAFFYNLARNQKMVSSSTLINYINLDEQLHVNFFVNVFQELLKENPELDTPEMKEWVTDTMKQAVELEKKWGSYIIGSKFEGIDEETLNEYIEFTANKRMNQMGLERPFEKRPNPMKWVKVFESGSDTKTDFFEGKARTYAKISDSNNFDEL